MNDHLWLVPYGDPEPPFTGRAALLIGTAAVALGISAVAALLVAGSWLRSRLR